MDHALTNQDLGSDDAASCEVPLDDTELQRRLEAHYERALTPLVSRMSSRQKWLWIVGVLAGLGMWWAFGVPQLLYGWFTDWWTMSSSSSRHQLDQATWNMLMDPNWTPPTIWQEAWEHRSGLALFIGGLFLLSPFLHWGFDRLSMRGRREMLQGVKAFGLHACPNCGADTRSVEGRHCRTCRENIRRDRVPAYWRYRIRDDFPADGNDIPSMILADHAPDPRTRRRAFFMVSAVFLLATAVLSVLELTGFSGVFWFHILFLLFIGIQVGLSGFFVSLQYSDSGRCPKCEYDLGLKDSDRCPECGTACPDGYRNHVFISKPYWFTPMCTVAWLGFCVLTLIYFMLKLI